MFIALLTSVVNASNLTKHLSLSDQKCTTQRTLVNVHPNEYIQGLHYYPFAVNLDRCVRSCDTLNDLSNELCVPNKTEDLNLRVFNMTTGINELKTLTKHTWWECKCKFDGRKCNSDQKWSNKKCWYERKNLKDHHLCEKILLHVFAKMVNI